MAALKRYILVRWRKRRWFLLFGTIFAVYAAFRSVAEHKDHIAGGLIAWACLIVIVILFPFHWGGEGGWDEKEWGEK